MSSDFIGRAYREKRTIWRNDEKTYRRTFPDADRGDAVAEALADALGFDDEPRECDAQDECIAEAFTDALKLDDEPLDDEAVGETTFTASPLTDATLPG